MIDLNHSDNRIKDFINSSITKFKEEHKDRNSIGIYCCPWSGWLTTNYNLTQKIEETENNCPDFEYVEFDFLELKDWEMEYEKDKPEFKLNNEIKIHDHELGDERFNQLIFNYLKPIILEIKAKHKFIFLLQMLDSSSLEIIE